jgi:hypothetical protein
MNSVSVSQMKYENLQHSGRIPILHHQNSENSILKRRHSGRLGKSTGRLSKHQFDELEKIHLANAHISWSQNTTVSHTEGAHIDANTTAAPTSIKQSMRLAKTGPFNTLLEENEDEHDDHDGDHHRRGSVQHRRVHAAGGSSASPTGSVSPSPSGSDRKISENRFGVGLPKLKETSRHEQHRRSNVLETALDLVGNVEDQMSEIAKLKKKIKRKTVRMNQARKHAAGEDQGHPTMDKVIMLLKTRDPQSRTESDVTYLTEKTEHVGFFEVCHFYIFIFTFIQI